MEKKIQALDYDIWYQPGHIGKIPNYEKKKNQFLISVFLLATVYERFFGIKICFLMLPYT